jgi:hypothetical protein
VTTIDVVLVRRVKNAPLVGAEHDFFNIEIAWSEEPRRTTFKPDRIEMVPPVFLRSEDDSAVIGDLERLERKQRKRIRHCLAAVKQLAPVSALRVCDPERPRPRILGDQWPLQFRARLANEHHMFAVG